MSTVSDRKEMRAYATRYARDRRSSDWVLVAIARAGHGDLKVAAKNLGHSERILRRWIRDGLGQVKMRDIHKLHELSGISLDYLMYRVGPFRPVKRAMGRTA